MPKRSLITCAVVMGCWLGACSDDSAEGEQLVDAGGPVIADTGTSQEAGTIESDSGADSSTAMDSSTGTAKDAAPTDAAQDAANDKDAAKDAGVTPSSLDAAFLDAGGLSEAGGQASAEAGSVPTQLGHHVIDLSTLGPESPGFQRVYATAEDDGRLGLPVATGHDCDGDGFVDYAFGSFRTGSPGKEGAGQVYLLFGTGEIGGVVDLAKPQRNVLRIVGAARQEATGSEVWIDDVTGDGVGDLLIARQNFRAAEPDRVGAGALTVLVGGAELRRLAANGGVVDLAAPPPDQAIFTIVGPSTLSRFGIWMRTGDVTGDGVSDIVVGADQSSERAVYGGSAYLIRGGRLLRGSLTVDLANFGSTTLQGNIARITVPAQGTRFHLGATVQIGDLDGNQRAEVLLSAALVRSGAGVLADGAPAGSAESSGGADRGKVYLLWDDNFPSTIWPRAYELGLDDPGLSLTTISGGIDGVRTNSRFGEEVLPGGDYDGDGRADLFVGDMVGVPKQGFNNAGLGYLLFDAARLRNHADLDVGAPPAGLAVTTLLGVSQGAISADTAASADFDADGFTDLVVSSPNASPLGRVQAGVIHILWGRPGAWPSTIDLANKPDSKLVQFTELLGASGRRGIDRGDMIGYGSGIGDINGDGVRDLLANEMAGNGLEPGALDSGSLIWYSGALLKESRPDCAGVLRGFARYDSCSRCTGGTTGLLANTSCDE